MFLVVPLVELRRVLNVDIDVHHEDPATFLCHVSRLHFKRSRHRFSSPCWAPGSRAWSQERHEIPTGDHLGSERKITPMMGSAGSAATPVASSAMSAAAVS